MKKMISLALAMVLVLPLAACGGKGGGTSADDPAIGKYLGQKVAYSEDDTWMSMNEIYNEGDNYIELQSGGKGVFSLDGDTDEVKWSVDKDGVLKMTSDGLECKGTLKDGLITLDDYWGFSLKMTFLKEGVDMPEAMATNLRDWWNGDWFGWWTVSSCTGDYAELEGDWWDICAVIDVGEDNTGTFEMWDDTIDRETGAAFVSISLDPSGAGEHGTMYSEQCWFINVPLEHADWIVDPALTDYEDLIFIDGWYEGEEGEFHYEVYLRPWGKVWDDVDEGSLPYVYETWYLPLIEAGEPMPDDFEGAVYGEGETMEETVAPGEPMLQSFEIQPYYSDTITTVSYEIPAGEWCSDNKFKGYVSIYNAPDFDSRKAGKPHIEVLMKANEDEVNYYLESYENVQEIASRTIDGVEMAGRTYRYMGFDRIEYYGQVSSGDWACIQIFDGSPDPGTEIAAIIDSLHFE